MAERARRAIGSMADRAEPVTSAPVLREFPDHDTEFPMIGL
jgi:hypothetical protein